MPLNPEQQARADRIIANLIGRHNNNLRLDALRQAAYDYIAGIDRDKSPSPPPVITEDEDIF